VPKNLFEKLLEADEPERRRSCWGFDDQIDVRVRAGLIACNGAEDGETGVAVLGGKCPEDRSSGLEE
jgi:hypothetical protein